MAEHKLEPSRLLALLDESVPRGILDDFLDDLPSFSRPGKEWTLMLRRRVCPVCGGAIPSSDPEVLWCVAGVSMLHCGDCCRVADALSRSYRRSRRGRWRRRDEWRRLIDTVWRAGLTRPTPRHTD
jgi:hypothetical protein